MLSNLLYPRLNALEGFCHIEGLFVIVTSQPFVVGRNAKQAEIEAFMGTRRFTRICEATWYRSADRLAIFDVGGSNLFANEIGELVPIDVIPVLARGALLGKLEEALRRVR